MKTDTRNTLPFLFSFLMMTAALPAQLAITEFIDDVHGSESKYEWVELYNFSQATVAVEGWTLSDDDKDAVPLGDFSIASGAFALLTDNKKKVEARWFDKVAQPNVYEVGKFALANKKDELVLRDGEGAEVWRLAYGSRGRQGRATFLAVDDFSVADYGRKGAPGIDRSGVDWGSSLGYQSNDVTLDAFAFAGGKDVGSPLQGGYSTVPEPQAAGVVMSATVILFSWCLRRRRLR